jgi:hypothetical protein
MEYSSFGQNSVACQQRSARAELVLLGWQQGGGAGRGRRRSWSPELADVRESGFAD